jgi:hypothetical protein
MTRDDGVKTVMNEELRREILELGQRDEETRTRLLKEGRLFDGYAEEMERVHLDNAARFSTILDIHGWPGISLVGDDCVQVAWVIAQHAISSPEFQQRCLTHLERAVEIGDAPPAHLAFLTDRIRFNQRVPQRYGTVFDWDEEGEISPWQIEEPETVDQRRAEVGLPPLADALETLRKEVAIEGGPPAGSFEKRQRDIEEWARRVGWI